MPRASPDCQPPALFHLSPASRSPPPSQMEPVTERQTQAPGEDLAHDGPVEATESCGGKEQADGQHQKKLKRPLKPLSQKKVKDYNEGLAKRGVVYLSRVPPFMKPAKVKHLMEQHGVVTRVREQPLPFGVRSKPQISPGLSCLTTNSST